MSKAILDINLVHTVVFDFDGVFTDNKVWVDQDGKESVRCDRGDGLAFDIVRAFQDSADLSAEFFILSKEANPVVLARAKKLKLKCHHGIKNKLSFMHEYLSNKLSKSDDYFSGLVYFGNDLNDLPLMRKAGYAVAPADAHARVQAIAHLVLDERGGEGCVRSFIEKLLGIDELTEEKLDELISSC